MHKARKIRVFNQTPQIERSMDRRSVQDTPVVVRRPQSILGQQRAGIATPVRAVRQQPSNIKLFEDYSGTIRAGAVSPKKLKNYHSINTKQTRLSNKSTEQAFHHQLTKSSKYNEGYINHVIARSHQLLIEHYRKK